MGQTVGRFVDLAFGIMTVALVLRYGDEAAGLLNATFGGFAGFYKSLANQ